MNIIKSENAFKMIPRFFGYLFLLFSIALPLLIGCTRSAGEKPVTAFVNVNLVPMTRDIVLPDQTVLVRKDRIEAVGPSDEIRVPKDAGVIYGSGAWLMPGLADMHMHTKDDWAGPAWAVDPLKLYIANGVTTVRCLGPLGSSSEYVLRWRDEVREEKRTGPNIYTSGPILYGPVPDPKTAVARQKTAGYDLVKIYSYVSPKEFQEVMTEAKCQGVYTAGHIPFEMGLKGVFSAGMNEIAHIEELDFEFFDFEVDLSQNRLELFQCILKQAAGEFHDSLKLDTRALEEKHREKINKIVDSLKTRDTSVCTTLTIGAGIANKLGHPDVFSTRPEVQYLPASYLETFHGGKEKHQVLFKGFEDLAPFKHNMEKILARKLNEAGVALVLGTDSGTGGMGIVPGFSVHDELRLLNESGLTPYEAIRTGTVNAAKVINKMTGEGDFGTVEAGKRADLILVRGNPLEDLSNLRQPLGVMAAGRWYPEEELKEMIETR